MVSGPSHMAVAWGHWVGRVGSTCTVWSEDNVNLGSNNTSRRYGAAVEIRTRFTPVSVLSICSIYLRQAFPKDYVHWP